MNKLNREHLVYLIAFIINRFNHDEIIELRDFLNGYIEKGFKL